MKPTTCSIEIIILAPRLGGNHENGVQGIENGVNSLTLGTTVAGPSISLMKSIPCVVVITQACIDRMRNKAHIDDETILEGWPRRR